MKDTRYESARSDVLQMVLDADMDQGTASDEGERVQARIVERNAESVEQKASKKDSYKMGNMETRKHTTVFPSTDVDDPASITKHRRTGGLTKVTPANTAISKRQYYGCTHVQASQETTLNWTEAKCFDQMQAGAYAVEGMGESQGTTVDEESISARTAELSGSMGFDTTAVDTSSSMAQAVPVMVQESMQNATPVPPSEDNVVPAHTCAKVTRRGSTLVLAILALASIFAFALVLGLAIKEEPNHARATMTPMDVPHEVFAKGLMLQGLPTYTLAALQDSTSPRSMAYDWLMSNPLLET